jgi:DNA gyrase inhibitor GyrI
MVRAVAVLVVAGSVVNGGSMKTAYAIYKAACGTALLIGCASLTTAQTPSVAALPASEARLIRAAALKPVKVALWTITQDFTGNFETMPKQMDQFGETVKAQNLDDKVGKTPTPIVVLYEDPTNKREFRFALGLQVTAKVEVKSPLKTEQVAQPRAVRATHVGPYQQLHAVHGTVVTTLREAKATKSAPAAPNDTDWPVIMRLLNDPRKTPAPQLKTELIIPTR